MYSQVTHRVCVARFNNHHTLENPMTEAYREVLNIIFVELRGSIL